MSFPPTPPGNFEQQPRPGMVPQNGMGVTALVLGIVGIVLTLCLGPLAVIASVLAVIFGGIGMKKVNQGLATNRPFALTGLILGVVGIALSVVWLLVFGAQLLFLGTQTAL